MKQREWEAYCEGWRDGKDGVMRRGANDVEAEEPPVAAPVQVPIWPMIQSVVDTIFLGVICVFAVLSVLFVVL